MARSHILRSCWVAPGTRPWQVAGILAVADGEPRAAVDFETGRGWAVLEAWDCCHPGRRKVAAAGIHQEVLPYP